MRQIVVTAKNTPAPIAEAANVETLNRVKVNMPMIMPRIIDNMKPANSPTMR
jgi:hypothetical protein